VPAAFGIRLFEHGSLQGDFDSQKLEPYACRIKDNPDTGAHKNGVFEQRWEVCGRGVAGALLGRGNSRGEGS
jgi:hypothetical protein